MYELFTSEATPWGFARIHRKVADSTGDETALGPDAGIVSMDETFWKL